MFSDETIERLEDVCAEYNDFRLPTPLHDRVLILPDLKPEKYAESIIVKPETYRRVPDRGIVVACGDDTCELAAGDVVQYDPFQGANLMESHVQFVIIPESHVFFREVPDAQA